MSNEQNVLKRRLGGGEISVPEDDLFAAWLEKVTGKSRSPVIEVNVVPLAKSVPRIGEVWPGQGGINGGLARDENGAPYWLIVSPAEIGFFDEIQWGGYGVDVPDAKSEFDGRANTVALLATTEQHPAAQKCAAVEHEGHRDYYLPAKREMAVLYANVRELFEGWHWSSTQYSAHNAWYQFFDDGYQVNASKSNTGRARAVRRLDF
jgi:hypothetical protein